MRNKEVWTFIRDSLRNRIPVTLIAVVESHGASPGRAGFKMAVNLKGDRCGTIGGGIMEVNWVEEIRNRRAGNNTTATVRTVFHSKETQYEPSGLICSGSQTILVKVLSADLLQIVESITAQFAVHQCGHLAIGPEEFAFVEGSRMPRDIVFRYKNDAEWRYEENVGVLDTLFIAGSGHVGLALSRVMAMLDFRVVVFDDRGDVATFAENTFAHEKMHLPYDRIGSYLSGNAREYVAVVTTGYKSDEAVLRSVLDKNPRYVGLMGSAAKTKQIFDDLKADGFTESQLRAIRTPIGLPIASHTPEEIAISIAAEIIGVRNNLSQTND